jgi:hypothetical protein
MEAVFISETSDHSNETTWRYIPEDSKLNLWYTTGIFNETPVMIASLYVEVWTWDLQKHSRSANHSTVKFDTSVTVIIKG